MNHTPEPWKLSKDYYFDRFIHGAYGETRIVTGVGFQHEENARRIVACVNACAGVYAEPDNYPCVAEIMRRNNELSMKYIELLDALERSVDRICDLLKNDDGQAWKEAERELPILKDKLAKARRRP